MILKVVKECRRQFRLQVNRLIIDFKYLETKFPYFALFVSCKSSHEVEVSWFHFRQLEDLNRIIGLKELT